MDVKAIPVPVRERILKLYDQGKGTAEIAAGLGYCVAAVRRVRQHCKACGTLEPQTHRCGRKSLLTESRRVRLETLLALRPDVAVQRKEWPRRLAGGPTACLVFVDESGASTQMTRRYGRSPDRPAAGLSGAARALSNDHDDCRGAAGGAAGAVAV